MSEVPNVLDQDLSAEVLREVAGEAIRDDIDAAKALPGAVFVRWMRPGEFDSVINWILAQGMSEIQRTVPGVRVFIAVEVTYRTDGALTRKPDYWVQYPETGESE